MPPKHKPALETLPTRRSTRGTSSQAQQCVITEKVVEIPVKVVQTAKMVKEAKALERKEKAARIDEAMKLLVEKEENERAEVDYQRIHGDKKPLSEIHLPATTQALPRASTVTTSVDLDSVSELHGGILNGGSKPSPNGGSKPSPNGSSKPSPNGSSKPSPNGSSKGGISNGGNVPSPNGSSKPSLNGSSKPSPNGSKPSSKVMSGYAAPPDNEELVNYGEEEDTMEVDGEGTCSKEDMMEVDFASDLENDMANSTLTWKVESVRPNGSEDEQDGVTDGSEGSIFKPYNPQESSGDDMDAEGDEDDESEVEMSTGRVDVNVDNGASTAKMKGTRKEQARGMRDALAMVGGKRKEPAGNLDLDSDDEASRESNSIPAVPKRKKKKLDTPTGVQDNWKSIVSAITSEPTAEQHEESVTSSKNSTPKPLPAAKLKKNKHVAVEKLVSIKPPTEPATDDSNFTSTTQAGDSKSKSNPAPRPSARKYAAKPQTPQTPAAVTPRSTKPLPPPSVPPKSATRNSAVPDVSQAQTTPSAKPVPKSKRKSKKQPTVEPDAPGFKPGGMVESDEDDGLEREIAIKVERGSAQTKPLAKVTVTRTAPTKRSTNTKGRKRDVRVTDLPSSSINIARQDIMPCLRDFKAALGAWINPTEADIRGVWNDYVDDHRILDISPNSPGRLLLDNLNVLVTNNLAQYTTRIATAGVGAVTEYLEAENISEEDDIATRVESLMGTWDEMKGGKWIQDRPYMWKSAEVGEVKRGFCLGSLVSRVLYEHLSMVSTIPVDERQTRPIGALVLATQVINRALRAYKTGKLVINRSLRGQFSASNWADGKVVYKRDPDREVLRSSHLEKEALKFSDKQWENIIAAAWAMKPPPSETSLRRSAATATVATARAANSDSDDSSSEDDSFFDAMYHDDN